MPGDSLLIIFQVLWTLPLIWASLQDLKYRKVIRGISTALIWSSLGAQYLIGNEAFLYAVLAGPAAAWVFEYFNLWKSFDSKMLIGLTVLHAGLWPVTAFLTLLLYGGFTVAWKKHVESHCPVVPVFLMVHIVLLLL